MYSKLKRVYAATSKKGIVPVYSALCIRDGTVMATDGAITRSALVDELAGIDAILPADKFIKAIQNISDNCRITATDLNVMIKDGKFSARIPKIQDTYFPEIVPDGKLIRCDGLVEALSAVAPFIGTDASHVWATGVMLTDNYVYATNNVTLVRYKVDMEAPNIVIPTKAVNELLKAGINPMGTVMRNNAVTFLFDDDSWLDTVLVDAAWPDVSKFFVHGTLPPIHPELVDAVKMVTPFCEDLPKILFSKNGITTGQSATGAKYEDIDLPDGCYHAEVLNKVLPRIEHVDWSYYPKPCPFDGEGGKLEGVIMGLRT